VLQHEEVFGPVMPGERCRDLGVRRATPNVPMLREGVGISLAGDDIAQNAQAGDAAARAAASPHPR
jgi:hypothetical protein